MEVLTAYACRHDDLDATFTLARLHMELNHFAEAAVLFERVANGPVGNDLTPIAFERWVEAIGVLGSFFGVTECFDAMAEAVPLQRERLCAFDLVRRHPEREAVCTTIGHIAFDIERFRVSEAL